jgi:hypothetical protein
MWQKVANLTLPSFLNPNRFPMKAPYNYLVLLGLPILFPTVVVLIIYKLATESKRSRARVLELDKGWGLEEGKGSGEKGRIDRLVRNVMLSAAEEQVDEERNILPTSPGSEDGLANVHEVSIGIDDTIAKRSPLQTPFMTENPKQPPLLDAQKRIVRALNDPKNVPRLEKRWAYFGDVFNCECQGEIETEGYLAGNVADPFPSHFHLLALAVLSLAHAIIVW